MGKRDASGCACLGFATNLPGPYIQCTGHDYADGGYLDDDDDGDGGGGDYIDENDWICNQPIPYPWPKT